MPRGIRTSTTPKATLVAELCKIININIDEVFNSSNGTITKELLQAVCTYLNLSNNLSKTDSANLVCIHLKLECTDIDFNDRDDTISAGYIEKIISNIQ